MIWSNWALVYSDWTVCPATALLEESMPMLFAATSVGFLGNIYFKAHDTGADQHGSVSQTVHHVKIHDVALFNYCRTLSKL